MEVVKKRPWELSLMLMMVQRFFLSMRGFTGLFQCDCIRFGRDVVGAADTSGSCEKQHWRMKSGVLLF